MDLEFHLRLAGILQVALAGLHVFFPKRFEWKSELSRLSLLNRQVFISHTFFVCLTLVLMGALSLFATEELLERGRLARMVLGGFGIFWGIRLLFQWFHYDWRLWLGNRFNTLMHFLFTGLWTYLSAVYLATFYSGS
jgi:hypothetical protein